MTELEIRYLVAHRAAPGEPWRRGSDYPTYAEAKAEAGGSPDAMIVASFPDEAWKDSMILRLNTPQVARLACLVEIAKADRVNETAFVGWWRRFDESLRLLDEELSTMGEAMDFYLADLQPSLAAIKLRRRRIAIRGVKAR